MRYIVGSIITLFLFTGCAKSTDHLEQQKHQTKEQMNFSTVTNETNIDQTPANEAKEIADLFDETTDIFAVNSNDTLMIAFDVQHMYRFQLESIKKDIKKQLNKKLPQVEIEVSTDAKIRLELEKLEQDLHNENISNQTVEKRIKKIVSLSKEQT